MGYFYFFQSSVPDVKESCFTELLFIRLVISLYWKWELVPWYSLLLWSIKIVKGVNLSSVHYVPRHLTRFMYDKDFLYFSPIWQCFFVLFYLYQNIFIRKCSFYCKFSLMLHHKLHLRRSMIRTWRNMSFDRIKKVFLLIFT